MPLARDAVTTAEGSSGGTSISFSHTCTGSDLLLAVLVMWADVTGVGTPSVTALTYNGVALTHQVTAQINWSGNNYNTCEIWTLAAPATGSNTVSVTLSEAGTVEPAAVAVSYSGADGIGSTTGSGTGTSTGPSATFTTESANSLILGGFNHHNSASAAPGTDVTELADFGSSAPLQWAGEKAAGGGSDTINATSSASNRWAMAAIEVKEKAGAGGLSIPVAMRYYRNMRT